MPNLTAAPVQTHPWQLPYIGAGLLGALAASYGYRMVCDGRARVLAGGTSELVWHVAAALAAVGGLLQTRDGLIRSAFLAFAAAQIAPAYASAQGVALPSVFNEAPMVASAVLMSATALRRPLQARRAALIAMVFGMTVVAAWATRLWGNNLVQPVSVVAERPWC